MSRRLPDDPVKRRLQIFKRLYTHMEHWHALMEDRGMPDIITTPDGEDIFLGDLMVGIDTLPKRQREAFTLVCLRGYTQGDARDELLPASPSSTPVQQYADSGLIRMVEAYDAKQAGVWPLPPPPKKSKIKRRIALMAALHPIVRKDLEGTRKKILGEMEALKVALAQVDEVLGAKASADTTAKQPAPNPRPEGKPALEDMAREMANAG